MTSTMPAVRYVCAWCATTAIAAPELPPDCPTCAAEAWTRWRSRARTPMTAEVPLPRRTVA